VVVHFFETQCIIAIVEETLDIKSVCGNLQDLKKYTHTHHINIEKKTLAL